MKFKRQITYQVDYLMVSFLYGFFVVVFDLYLYNNCKHVFCTIKEICTMYKQYLHHQTLD